MIQPIKSTVSLLAAFAMVACSLALAAEAMGNPVKIFAYHAEEADVNSYVLADAKGTFIIDTTRNSKEARKVAELAKSKGNLLNAVAESSTEDEAKAKMVALYPDYRNADFLLTQGVKFQMTQIKR